MQRSLGVSSRAAGKFAQAVGIVGAAIVAASATPSNAQARDSFYGFSGPYTPRGYYGNPYFDNRSRYDDGYTDPLIRRTAEQLRRAPKPPPTKGPLLVSVSLASQRLTVYDDGVAIAQSKISTGTAEHPTPTGLFSVIQKQRWHRSNLYSDAPMPFMQRITWSGIALHAGKLPGYPASHGCIRLPDDFAVRMWRTTAIGARVVITQREIAPAEISHPKLFVLPPADAVPVAQSKPLVQPAVATSPGPGLVPPAAAPSAVPAGVSPAAAVAREGSDPAAKRDAKSETTTESTAETKVEIKGDSKGETRVASAGPVAPAETAPAEKTLRAGPVSVFVSRKEQRVYVRKGFEPLFDMPVVIQNPDQALGTHLFVANTSKDGGRTPKWMVVSPPAKETGVVTTRHDLPSAKRNKTQKVEAAAPVTPAPQSTAAAAAALDRIELPAEAVTRIAELMSVGAALTISDEGLGPETGKETDFSVVTSPIQPTKKRQPSYERFEAERYWTPPSRRWF